MAKRGVILKKKDLRRESHRVKALQLRDEGVGTHDVERRDAEDLLGVVLSGLLVDLGRDGDGAVDRVGNDGHDGVRAHFSGSLKTSNCKHTRRSI